MTELFFRNMHLPHKHEDIGAAARLQEGCIHAAVPGSSPDFLEICQRRGRTAATAAWLPSQAGAGTDALQICTADADALPGRHTCRRARFPQLLVRLHVSRRLAASMRRRRAVRGAVAHPWGLPADGSHYVLCTQGTQLCSTRALVSSMEPCKLVPQPSHARTIHAAGCWYARCRMRLTFAMRFRLLPGSLHPLLASVPAPKPPPPAHPPSSHQSAPPLPMPTPTPTPNRLAPTVGC